MRQKLLYEFNELKDVVAALERVSLNIIAYGKAVDDIDADGARVRITNEGDIKIYFRYGSKVVGLTFKKSSREMKKLAHIVRIAKEAGLVE